MTIYVRSFPFHKCIKVIFNYSRCLILLLVDIISAAVLTVVESMTDVKKPNKRNKRSTQTVTNRLAIGANWQALLASAMLRQEPEKEPAKPSERFTGTFRRARKKNRHTLNAALPDINTLDIDKQGHKPAKVLQENAQPEQKSKLTKFVAMDCEMVGIGPDAREHMLARVSVVNRFGDCIYDKFVKAREEVADYRTKISGIRKEDMLNGEDFNKVQREVAELLRGRILVGHSLKNDLSVLFLSHPKRQIRDTAKYKPFRKITHGSIPSLKRLAAELLGTDIQGGEHSSVEDARAAMQLYVRAARDWEQQLSSKRKHRPELDA